jgi:5-hydroxyisourate hydrolase-like protein (transthyretin family)
VFHVAEYYKRMGIQQTTPEFLDVVPIRIAIYDAASRYHVPLYFSPWGFMTYRGS